MKIVVLAGGTSTERDISIVSGLGAATALRNNGHEVYLLDVFFGCTDTEAENAFDNKQDFETCAESLKKLTKDVPDELNRRKCFFGPNVIRLCSEADGVFMALHGANGEDGKVQAAFDLFGISYTGCNYLGSAIAMDKGLTKIMFNYFGVSTPKGFVVNKADAVKKLPKGMSFPVVVKPLRGGSSVGVEIALNAEDYIKALDAAFAYEDKAVVETYIKGREFSCAVIGKQVFPVIEIIVEEGFYDYVNKYNGKTREVCPAPISEDKANEIQALALKAVEALGITGYSRMDFIMDETGKIFCLEANTLPGMTPTSLIPQEAAAIGISYEQLCEKLMNIR